MSQLPPIPPSVAGFFDFATVENDYRVMDDLQGVYYFIRYQDAVPITNPANAIPIPNCLKRARGKVLNDYLQSDDQTWHIWVSQMPTLTGPLKPDGVTPYWTSPFTPGVGDIIMDPLTGWLWLVERIDFQTFISRYRLACRKYVVSSSN